MTGTDLCVNKPHCAAAVRPWESEATTSTLPHTVVGVCGEFQRTGRFLQRGIWSQCVVPRSAVPSVRSSLQQLPDRTEQVLTRAEGRVEVVASLSQGRKAAAQCGFFTRKSVPVIFEPPCNMHFTKATLYLAFKEKPNWWTIYLQYISSHTSTPYWYNSHLIKQ